MERDDEHEAGGRVVTPGFHARVYAVVKAVPAGAVATYGDVATILGSPRVARHVGWALAALPQGDVDVPWHRIINGKGTISDRGDLLRAEMQRDRLESEGVTFDANGRVDLRRHRWTWPDRVR